MPIFEFECLECEEVFEKIITKTKQVLKCPECDSLRIKKRMSSSHFKIKGYSEANGYSK